MTGESSAKMWIAVTTLLASALIASIWRHIETRELVTREQVTEMIASDGTAMQYRNVVDNVLPELIRRNTEALNQVASVVSRLDRSVAVLEASTANREGKK